MVGALIAKIGAQYSYGDNYLATINIIYLKKA